MKSKSEKIYLNALKRLYAYAQTHNMRPSSVRKIVLEQACKLHQPFTADQLIQVCAAERISTGTVYNALKVFVDAHILSGKQRQRGHLATEYECILDASKHMQFVCKNCGRTVDFNDKAIARLIEERKYTNFIMNTYSLVVYGECKTCRRKVRVKSEELRAKS